MFARIKTVTAGYQQLIMIVASTASISLAMYVKITLTPGNVGSLHVSFPPPGWCSMILICRQSSSIQQNDDAIVIGVRFILSHQSRDSIGVQDCHLVDAVCAGPACVDTPLGRSHCESVQGEGRSYPRHDADELVNGKHLESIQSRRSLPWLRSGWLSGDRFRVNASE
ncbi:hypothetical protein BJ742DRAFT_525198 [Cladochytrium replicatum]|nr:hypothetical protein BJ742DRAFT_525198 [Cladochytrium replicatum]